MSLNPDLEYMRRRWPDLPVIEGYRTREGEQRLWCDRCERWHYHGTGGPMPAPHCDRPPFLLRYVGTWPDDVPHGTIQRATATPRCRCGRCRAAVRWRPKSPNYTYRSKGV